MSRELQSASWYAMIRVFIGVLVLLSNATSLFAAKIKVETAVRQPSVVIGKPMLTWWDVRVEGPGLAVGQLEFFVKHNERLISVTQTDELTFSGSDQRIRVMLPGVRWITPIDQLQVEIYFRTKDGTQKLDPQILRSPFMNKKVFIALVSDSRVLSSQSVVREKLLDQLKFENLTTSERFKKNLDDDREFVKTIFAPIEAADFPADPHNYCCYDLVILMDDELRSLRKGQLDAILAWVRAGGSLYVEPRGVLDSIHTEFLTSLASESSQGIVFQTEPSGQLLADTIPADQFAATFPCGIGVAVVRTAEADTNSDEQDERWYPVAKALWRLRENPTTHQVATPNRRFYVGKNGQPVPIPVENLDPYGTSASATTRTSLDQIGVLERLKPDGVRMVPTWMLSLILVFMILLIGPVDYMLLGWMRLRKLTWLTFPLVTIATTSFLVRISDRYMSTSEQVNATRLHDVDGNGSIVRTNRLELMYPTSTRRDSTEVQKGLFALVVDPTQTQRLTGVVTYDPSGEPYRVVNGELVRHSSGAIEFEGRIPTRYTVKQNVMKWTPQLYRILEIPSEPIPTDVDWSVFQISTSDLPNRDRHIVPDILLHQVRRQFGPNAHCAGFFGQDGWFHDVSNIWNPGPVMESQHLQNSQNRQLVTLNSVASGEPSYLAWIHNASSASTNPGIFSLLKQTSPTGDGSCEDLMLFDSTNDREWLLVVVVAHPNRYDVYRKRMTLTD